MRWAVEVAQFCCPTCHSNYSASEWRALPIVEERVLALAGGGEERRVRRTCSWCAHAIGGEAAAAPVWLTLAAFRRTYPESHRDALAVPVAERWWERVLLWLGWTPRVPPP